MKKYNRYSQEQIDWLTKMYKRYTINELLPMFNKKFGLNIRNTTLKSILGRYSIYSGRTGQFVKGHIPYSKGKKWDEFMSKESQERSKTTWFKKGGKDAVKDYKPVGSETLRAHKGRQTYWWIKIKQPNVWVLKHRYLWEKYNNKKIPAGHKVMFLDGDVNNFDKDNLVLISRQEHGVLNMHRLYKKGDKELSRLGLAAVRLEQTVNKLIKERSEQKHGSKK